MPDTITRNAVGALHVSDDPIIPLIEGDGIAIAPGANINYVPGHVISEATHGTTPKYAGRERVNPGSALLSGIPLFEPLGWTDAANDIVRAMVATICEKIVADDFARQLDAATEVKCSEFGSANVDRL